jgi:hypothetical protein
VWTPARRGEVHIIEIYFLTILEAASLSSIGRAGFL